MQSENPDQTLLVSYLTIRKAVGVLGISLSIVLVLGSVILESCNNIQDSISDYYYTIMGNYLVGTLCAIALFLFSYNGYDRMDRISSSLACLFALGIAFFPTSISDPSSLCNITTRSSSSLVSTVHYVSAGLFFITLAYISLFLFTKMGLGRPTSQKLKRNIIYKTCGVIILASILLIFVYHIIPSLHPVLSKYKPTFCLETLALW